MQVIIAENVNYKDERSQIKMITARDYLERTLITAKGLVERAKEKLDKLWTFKTFMSEFFTVFDVRKDFLQLQNTMQVLSSLKDYLIRKLERQT